ncbi:hypothetical protein [Candidatus Mycobacterium methanotrophicum]|uniref:Transposase n=1 Tax=Candidatus Mycobacterium methanotrophicum TaxID=2943498 RepID=A0ABY4QI49_9MYCO|nr:hypothetical protein [Candidatus Mycobacterium methanotrophicum]UQX10544.1 hypothetical protein M5I08_21220 [Candidatus Mycobacterium methanotrophicum]
MSPADPASKGGVENAVKLPKADIVPAETNLLAHYDSFAEVEVACAAFTEQVNTRVHRATRRVPAQMLVEERARLHQVPDLPHTAALGVTRRVPDNTPHGHLRTLSILHSGNTVGAKCVGPRVWVRHHDGTDEVVICALDDGGPIDVARHRRTSPGNVDSSGAPPLVSPNETSFSAAVFAAPLANRRGRPAPGQGSCDR